MRAVIQRVREACVIVNELEVSSIGRGLLVLAAFAKGDDQTVLEWMARKIPSLRIFEDEKSKMNLSLENLGGEMLVVSQFTLYGNCKKGRRPSFDKSAPPEKAAILYAEFIEMLKKTTKCSVKGGVFREHMQVSLVNDGPVTLIIDREAE